MVVAANQWLTAFLSFVPESNGVDKKNSTIKEIYESKNGSLPIAEYVDEEYEKAKEKNSEWNAQFYKYLNTVGHSDEDIKAYEYNTQDPWESNNIGCAVRPNPKVNCLLASMEDMNDIIDTRFDEDDFASIRPKKKAPSLLQVAAPVPPKPQPKVEEKPKPAESKPVVNKPIERKDPPKKPDPPKITNTENLKCPICSHMNSSKWHYVRHVNQCRANAKAKNEPKKPSPVKKTSPAKKPSPKKQSTAHTTPKVDDRLPQRNAAARAVASFLEEEVEDPDDLKSGKGITPGVSLPTGDDLELFKGLGFDDNDEESFLTQEWKELAGDFKLNESDDELAEELLKNWSTDDLLAETLLNKKKEEKARAAAGLTSAKAKPDPQKSLLSKSLNIGNEKRPQSSSLKEVKTPKKVVKQEDLGKSSSSSNSTLRQVRPPISKEKSNMNSKPDKEQTKRDSEKMYPPSVKKSPSRKFKCSECSFSNDLKFELDFHIKMKHFDTGATASKAPPSPLGKGLLDDDDIFNSSLFSSSDSTKKQESKSSKQATKTSSSDFSNRGVKRESDFMASLAGNNNQKRPKLDASPKSKSTVGKKDINQNDWKPTPMTSSWPKTEQASKPKPAPAAPKGAMVHCDECDFTSSSQLNLNTHIIIMH